MADPTWTLGGQYGRLFFIEEADPNTTPDAASWNRVAPLKSFKPTFNRNMVPLTSAGSKRLVGHAKHGPFDIGWTMETQAWGDLWLEYLKFILGSATGTGDPATTGDKLKTLSFIAEVKPDANAAGYQAVLYNGCHLQSATLKKQQTADPISIQLAGRAQYAQRQATSTPTWIGFQGTGGNPLNVASFGSLPDPNLPPVKYYHFQERIVYEGQAIADLPRVGGWELGMTQALAPIPGRVVGADGNVYPVWKGFGEDGMEVALKLQVVPEDWDYYKNVLYDDLHIDYIDLIYTAPPGYSVATKTIRLKESKWETGDYSIEEAVTMSQELVAKFASVEVL